MARELTNQMIRRVSDETKTGCLVVSHDVKSALELADRIVLLDEGQVVFQGDQGEFSRSKHELVQAFLKGIEGLDV